MRKDKTGEEGGKVYGLIVQLTRQWTTLTGNTSEQIEQIFICIFVPGLSFVYFLLLSP